MSVLRWFSVRMLRRVSPRSFLSVLLLAALVTGAASYVQGSRYAIVPAGVTLPSAQGPASSSPPAQTGPAVGDASALDAAAAAGAVAAAEAASCVADSETPELDCCQRRSAPRGVPVPVRAAVFDPPATAPQLFCADGLLSAVSQPQPDLPALTVILLSISRT